MYPVKGNCGIWLGFEVSRVSRGHGTCQALTCGSGIRAIQLCSPRHTRRSGSQTHTLRTGYMYVGRPPLPINTFEAKGRATRVQAQAKQTKRGMATLERALRPSLLIILCTLCTSEGPGPGSGSESGPGPGSGPAPVPNPVPSTSPSPYPPVPSTSRPVQPNTPAADSLPPSMPPLPLSPPHSHEDSHEDPSPHEDSFAPPSAPTNDGSDVVTVTLAAAGSVSDYSNTSALQARACACMASSFPGIHASLDSIHVRRW